MYINPREGMSFDEILAHGEDDSLYSALKSTVLDQAAFDTNDNAGSELMLLIQQLKDAQTITEQMLISDAIVSQFTERATQLSEVVQSDLVAQQAVKQKLANLNIAAELLPPAETNVPDLVELIATKDFKKIFDL